MKEDRTGQVWENIWWPDDDRENRFYLVLRPSRHHKQVLTLLDLETGEEDAIGDSAFDDRPEYWRRIS